MSGKTTKRREKPRNAGAEPSLAERAGGPFAPKPAQTDEQKEYPWT